MVAGVCLVGAMAVGAGAVVATSSGQRVAGQPASGSISGSVSADVGRARELFSQGRTLDALKLYDSVLQRQPDDAEARAYRGWLLFQVSRSQQAPADLTDRALASLDKAVSVDPRFPDAHFFRGYVLLEGKGDAAGAVPELRTYLATGPPQDMRSQVQQVLDAALCRSGQAPPGTPCPAPGAGSS